MAPQPSPRPPPSPTAAVSVLPPERASSASRRLLIALLGFARTWWVDPCDGPSPCEFTTDPARLAEADVVVFDAVELDRVGEVTRAPGQVWVAFTMESDVTVPGLADRATMAHFDITMTVRRSSDVWCPYVHPRLLADLMRPPRAKTAAQPVARIQSNPYDRSGRNEYAARLMRRLKVASYGGFARTQPWPIQSGSPLPDDHFWREVNYPELDGERSGDIRMWTGRAREEKLAVIAPHKFTLAFENSISPDYVTEKFFDPLVAGSVPVYLGAPDVADYAPAPHSYIDTADFSGPDEVATYLNHLDQHDDEYQAYLAWKQEGLSDSFCQLVAAAPDRPFCTLAELVHQRFLS